MNEVMLVKVDGVMQPRMVADRPVITTMDGCEYPCPPVPEVREGEILLQYMDGYEIRSTR